MPTTILIADDDTQAEALLADVLTADGLRAIDAGAARRASEPEAPAFLQITLAAQRKVPWTGGFAMMSCSIISNQPVTCMTGTSTVSTLPRTEISFH